MSDETKSNNSEWQMPDPVFQTSEGRTPKSAKNYVDPDDVDTAAPDFTEADTDEFDTEPGPISQDEVDTETPEAESDEVPVSEEPSPQNTVRASAIQKQTGGCAKTFGLISAVIAFSVIAVIAVIIYFMIFYKPADTAF